jgi:serine phosphatase RsbU (regulator of sigma subunit)
MYVRCASGWGRAVQDLGLSLDRTARLTDSVGHMERPLVMYRAQGEMVAADAVPEALEEDVLARWGVVLGVPLVAQEELVGLLALGPKLSEDGYTRWDRELLSALSDQAATAITMGRLVSQIRTRERMDQELRMARQIQTSLLPKVACEIPGFDIAAYWRAAREVGGDFYDFIPLSNGGMGLVVADVSDKGVPAALFMALSRALVRASAVGSPAPGEALRRANELILADASSGMFVTLLYAILDPASHGMTYVNAGHMPPLLSRRDGILPLRTSGIALGITEDIELETREVQLSEGDVIVLYTDGVTDAINGRKEEFGQTRLAKVIAENRDLTAEGLVAKINAAVANFVGGERQFDDFTLLVLKYVDEELWSGLCLIDETEGQIPRPFLS